MVSLDDLDVIVTAQRVAERIQDEWVRYRYPIHRRFVLYY